MSQILQLAGMITQNLPEIHKETMQYWIANPKDLKGFLDHLANSRLPITLESTDEFRSPEDFWRILKQEGISVSDKAVKMIQDPAFTMLTCAEEMDLVALSSKDLGYAPPRDKGIEVIDPIYHLAQKRGLLICPPDVGPRLRRLYRGDEALIIAMKPIRNLLFQIWPDDEKGNTFIEYDEFDEIYEHEKFVFVKPRKS